MTTTSPLDPLAFLQALTEEDVQAALDDLARQEKMLRTLLLSLRRRKAKEIRARRMPPLEEQVMSMK